MYANHIDIRDYLLAKGKAKVQSDNIEEFAQAFKIFTKLDIQWEETYKHIYNIRLK